MFTLRTLIPLCSLLGLGAAPLAAEKPVYLDAIQPSAERVEDLLSSMTLRERAGQMNMPCVYRAAMCKDPTAKTEARRLFTLGKYAEGVWPGGGFFTLADNILPKGPRQQVEFFNDPQRLAIENTRLKIPLLQSEEGTHGLMRSGGTIFPEGRAVGSTWNPDLVERIDRAAAREACAVGIHKLYTLAVEPNRDPRRGRNQEGYSEDRLLCPRFAEAIVPGAQGDTVAAPDKVVAGLCHDPGQSEPVSRFEHGAMEIPERVLREVFLPPGMAGIAKGGV